jgi:hypothetical protein
MCEFVNPYLELYSTNTAEVIFKYENEFREKVNSSIYVDNKLFMEKFINELKLCYTTNDFFMQEFSEIVNSFSNNNIEYLFKNFCNDLTDIIDISLEEFESVPTKNDLELLKFNLEELNKSNETNESNELSEPKELEELEELEETQEYSLIDKIYATLYGINKFVTKDNLDYKNLIIYILRFSTLRKKLLKDLSKSEDFKDTIKELGLDKITDKYISEQVLKSVNQKDIEIILKNNTFYSLKYFKEYN